MVIPVLAAVMLRMVMGGWSHVVVGAVTAHPRLRLTGGNQVVTDHGGSHRPPQREQYSQQEQEPDSGGLHGRAG